jgi:hypothetical protein
MVSPGIRTIMGALNEVPLPIALAVLALGTLVLAISLIRVYKFRASKTWISTTGKIISSEMETRRGGRRRSITYHAAIVYDYSVEGTKYSGNRICFGDYGSSDANHARQILNRYPAGMQVSVYYNPSKPKDAVLERRLSWTVYLALIVGFAVSALGILLAIRYFQA